MIKKNLNPTNSKPVIRKTAVSLPELHEEQLAGGLVNGNAIAPKWSGLERFGSCSFDGDDA